MLINFNLDELKKQIKDELLEELRKELIQPKSSVATSRAITDLARESLVADSNYEKQKYAGGVSQVVRVAFKVDRLDQLEGEDLIRAVDMTKELNELVNRYRKDGET